MGSPASLWQSGASWNTLEWRKGEAWHSAESGKSREPSVASWASKERIVQIVP